MSTDCDTRDKLSVFEGALSSKAAKETTGNRSSVGALHGRGIVSAWAKVSFREDPYGASFDVMGASTLQAKSVSLVCEPDL